MVLEEDESLVVVAVDSVDEEEVDEAEVSEDELLEVVVAALSLLVVVAAPALDRGKGSKALTLSSLLSTLTEPESTAKRARQSRKNERMLAVLDGSRDLAG